MSKTLLKTDNIVIDYGIVRAIKGISLEVKEGTIVAILGSNGAGKSTLIKSISGMTKVKSGTITFNGKRIENLRPYEITKLRVSQSPEGRQIFNGLNVEENLLVGAYSLKGEIIEEEVNGVIIKKKISKSEKTKQMLSIVYDYFPVLEERKKQQASTLSGGEQQMLAIGRALMSDPELLLLDEPSLGLAPLIVQEIFSIIETIKKRGKSILIVEQNAYQTLKIADYAYVLELGKIKTEGKAEVLLQDESLVEAYLGGN